MQARILTGPALAQARAWAQARPLEQALLLADLTQLAEDSLPAGAYEGGRLRGLACLYRGLPFLAVALWSTSPAAAAALLSALAGCEPQLRAEPAYALVPAPILAHLQEVAHVEAAQEEIKCIVPPQGLCPPSAPARWRAASLGPQDLPALEDLYRSVPAVVWAPKMLGYGPWRGVYARGELASAAGVHFATPWVSELGHIVTRPAYRRQGMAEAVVRALVGDLQGRTAHIYLMHFSDNEAAGRLYARLGFVEYGRLMLARFRLRGPEALKRSLRT